MNVKNSTNTFAKLSSNQKKMPSIIENRQINEMSNKDKEKFLSFEMKEDYSFKYIPESHFKHIVKNVQRQRRKEDEERIWTSFVKEQELNDLDFYKTDDHQSMQSIKGLLQENILDVDRELKRLQEDALPERNKGIHKSGIKREKIYIEANQTKINSPKEKLLVKDKGNKSTNVLIPILQEDVSNCKDSERLKKVAKSKTKKSLSDSLIMQKKCYTNELLRATNQFENNSNSDSSNNRDGIIYIQPEPLTIHKILSMQKKIAELLNEISFRLSRIPLPDGDNDLKRRQQQTIEFAIWFSRNYLYNLNRLVASIQKHIRIVSSRMGLKQYHKNIVFHQDIIKQKLIAAHQLLVQALNAYCKHIPNSILEGHSTKLQEVLQIVYNLKDICDKVEISANSFCSGDATIMSLGKDLQEKCDTILSKLKLYLENKHRLARCKNSESTVSLVPVSSPHKGHFNRKHLSSRLSMYNMDIKISSKNNQRKKTNFRRKSYSHPKKIENNVVGSKNMYAQRCSVPELLYPSPISCTSSSKDVPQTGSMKNMSCLKEENIKTMMDGVSIDTENDSNLNVQVKYKNMEQQSAVLKKKSSGEMCQSKHTENDEIYTKVKNVANNDDLIKKLTAITKEHLATLAPVISDLITFVSKKQNESEVKPVSETSMETLMEFLQKYQSPKDSDTKALLRDEDCEQSRSKLNGSSGDHKHGGNVRLICMSSMDKISKTTQCNVSCQADEITLRASDDKKTVNLNTKEKVKLVVPKEIELQFLAYRLEYKKQCQSRPMYSSNTQNKPWNIVAWISDKLIEELIIEIAKELQMNGVEIIQKLFEMEFQEF
ncbi:uncharacterized protein LOC114878806 [Osmia bicornis bicornis]|uniref:uncharacterized protein LOC114878806 n=1 Tax=Osmia bicornis bicornis TaxID=1437191 RepID=UPI001EAF7218|nr:uncharacterized protein LOC114878806 [Osmia bicornis bicornis]